MSDESPPIIGSKAGPGGDIHDAGLSPMDPEGVPDGYPEDLEQWIEVDQGHRIWVRPIVPEDIARIVYAFEHADIDTIRRRFFTAAPPTDRAHLEYLANVDYTRRLALVAMDGEGNSVGIGRFEATDGTDAEVAIVVAPEWRRLGVAAALLRALEDPGRSRGVTRFVGLYLPENTAVERLLQTLGYGGRRMVDGIAELAKDLVDPPPVASPE